MPTIKTVISNLVQLDENSWNLFDKALDKQLIEKNQEILKPGENCQHIYFVETGLLRSFCIADGEEQNVAFTVENSFVTDLKSLRSGEKSELCIQALEPSVVFCISKNHLLALYKQSHQIEEFGRKLLESLLAENEEQMSWFRLFSARERYDRFANKYPQLLQRISLGHLSSYLGVRRETLSRIRKQK